VESILVWPIDRVEIIVKIVMMYSLCWPSDPAWVTVNPSFY